MEVEFRKAFYHAGERLFSYPVDCEGEDFHQAIVEQLAFECGCRPSDIDVYLEQCAFKEHVFSRDCAVERLEAQDGDDRWRILHISTGSLYTHTGPLDEFVAKYEAGEV